MRRTDARKAEYAAARLFRPTIVGVLLALAACGSLPDIERGKQALKAGNAEQAEQDLYPLAEMGYFDAQRELARLQAQRESPEALREAAAWYRSALERDRTLAVPYARVLAKLGDPQSLDEAEALLAEADARGDPRALLLRFELYLAHPGQGPAPDMAQLAQRVADLDTPEAHDALIRWFRVQRADPRAQQQLRALCETARERVTECYADLVRFERAQGRREAVRQLGEAALASHRAGRMPGRVLERVAWAMVTEDIPGPQYPDEAYDMLKGTGAKSTLARVRQARLLIEFPHLDPGLDPEALLKDAITAGSAEAALALGRLYMTGRAVPADPGKAQEYLQQAAPTLPAAHFFLGRLYYRGELGRVDPVAAAEHFLAAARSGYPRADHALAELFSENRGVRVNRVNAWVFATLAARAGVTEAPELVGTLQRAMSKRELDAARKLLAEEIAQRPVAPPGSTATAGIPRQPESMP